MILLFEDNPDDLIPQLFQKAYNKNDLEDFVFTKGNAGLKPKAVEILETTDEDVIIFFDMAPGNPELKTVYKTLNEGILRNNSRVVVFPIICSEYYMIRSIFGTSVMTKLYDIREVLGFKQPYVNSTLLETEVDRRFAKNFEKYCKLVLHKCVLPCVENSKHENGENQLYGVYYNQSCRCTTSYSFCTEITLYEKALKLITEYPCYLGTDGTHGCPIDKIDMYKLHSDLVDLYNAICTRYCEEWGCSERKFQRIHKIIPMEYKTKLKTRYGKDF